SDVIGTSVFNLQTSEFNFKRGPIFANIVLIDEINRSPAKTQSALFEVMEERQITHDGDRYEFNEPFMVIATQNPIEQEGTYRLPEAQLDRFLFRIKMKYPELDEERAIIKRFRNDFNAHRGEEVTAVLTGEQIMELRKIVEKVYIKDELCDYIADIVVATRNTGSLYLGASPRASLSILRTAKAYALMAGRSFVTPDDIQEMCYPVLNHRVLLSSERELEGIEPEQVIKELIQSIEVPR
ncbi:MAG: MoxR-like ATPase, partial [Limisphaerales bacterium]